VTGRSHSLPLEDTVELLTDPDAWVALLTLTALEVVLGIDNIVFISILAGKLPAEQRARARQVGLFAAMGMRILLLLAIGWVVGLTEPLFSVLGRDVSGRDIILIGGGLFLLAKATWEIHGRLEGQEHATKVAAATSFASVIVQIMLLDIVFSLDSVITAVGMSNQLPVMISAVVIAVLVMLFASGPVSELIERHPTLKMLALSFLLLIGVVLVAEGLGQHIEKGYIYFAMGFSVLVEFLNIRASRRRAEPAAPVQLRDPYAARVEAGGPAGTAETA
jgi:predicted tellurium resistance membrane protein TerC